MATSSFQVPLRVLIVESDPFTRRELETRFENASWKVSTLTEGSAVCRILKQDDFLLIVLSHELKDMDGLELFRQIRKNGIETPVIFFSAHGTNETVIQAIKLGAIDCITTPPDPSALDETSRKLIGQKFLPASLLTQQMDDYIRNFCANANLRVSMLSTHFHISRRYVSKLFRQHLNMAFRDRVAYHRIEKVKSLLSQTNLLMYEIADQCGFKQQSRMNNTFRRITQTTPTQYRRMHGNNFPEIPRKDFGTGSRSAK